ncbi:MAG: hypothetical protein J3K34DRAFT_518620 [Monoraphidium minutum]|nr:MAG: hypothetical protein J3K34DRAFT_518620 [Monoraphidium minutum]
MWVWEGGTPFELPQPVQRLLLNLPRRRVAAAPGGGARGDGGAGGGGAQQLKAALAQAQQTDGVAFWRGHLLQAAGSLVQYGGVLSAVASVMSPQGPGVCDHCRRERGANLLTSLPYAWIGVHGLRRRTTHRGRAWGASLLGVAGGSLAFHASSGRWRSLGRKADYWVIAVSSSMLTRALYPGQPASVTAASLLATPFRPFAVTTLHTTAMELAFLRRALADASLRPAQRAHSGAALLGMGIFFFEDARPHVPFIHAAWHLCSASATAAVHALLADTEARLAAAGAGGGGAKRRAAARRLPAPLGCERAAAAAGAAAGPQELAVLPLRLTS